MVYGRQPVLSAAAAAARIPAVSRTTGRSSLAVLAAALLAACSTVTPTHTRRPAEQTPSAQPASTAQRPSTAEKSALSVSTAAQPRETQASIALLLPLTGPVAGAAATIRDGFMTAYYSGPAAGRPRVRLYDTGALSVALAVQQAMHAGATFIVGPLVRPAVAAAAALQGARPPILALNELPTGRAAPGAFYQFALSPEAEARAVARRIVADGHHDGIALVPSGDWGNRVLAALGRELTADGASLVATARFDPELSDLAPAIRAVLGIDASRARRRALESLVGPLHSESRRRQDIDFVFEASQSPATARLLHAELRFYYAGGVAAYATSDSFAPNPVANQELDGLEFPDMPWMLGSGLADAVHAVATSAWPVKGPSEGPLFAFGFDAYRLFNALRSQSTGTPLKVEGLTGDLSLGAQGRVRRSLEWAQISGGQPHLLAPAPPARTPSPAAASAQGAGASTAVRPSAR